MDTKTIINYLQCQVDWKVKSLKRMDKRYKIPKKMRKEVDELKSMINHLSKINKVTNK